MVGTVDAAGVVIRADHVEVWLDLPQQFGGVILIEDGCRVGTGDGTCDGGSDVCGLDWPAWPFAAAVFVAVHGHDQTAAEFSRDAQKVEMAGMEHVEAAVDEDDFMAFMPPPVRQFDHLDLRLQDLLAEHGRSIPD